MIPDSWFALLAFGLLVTPGLVFDLLEDRARAVRKETAFREISRTVVFSVVFAVVALPFTVLSAALWPGTFVGLGEVLRTSGSDADLDRVRVAWTLALQCALSTALACLWHFLYRRGTSASIATESAWSTAFRRYCPPGKVPYVRVSLDAETAWEGFLASFSPDYEHGDREIVLCRPLVKFVGGQRRPLPEHWETVVLRGDDLKAILIRYGVPDPPFPAPVSTSRWRTAR